MQTRDTRVVSWKTSFPYVSLKPHSQGSVVIWYHVSSLQPGVFTEINKTFSKMHLVGPETNLLRIDGTFTAILFVSIRQVNKWLSCSWLNPNQQLVWQALNLVHSPPNTWQADNSQWRSKTTLYYFLALFYSINYSESISGTYFVGIEKLLERGHVSKIWKLETMCSILLKGPLPVSWNLLICIWISNCQYEISFQNERLRC